MKRNPLILLAATLAAPATVLAQSWPGQPEVTWVAAGSATQPAGIPVPLTPAVSQAVRDALWPKPIPATIPSKPPEVLDPRGIYVKDGSWAAAVKAAKSGQVVYLEAGREYTERLVSTDGKLAPGISVATWGSPPATIHVPDGSAVLVWKQNGLGFYSLVFKADKGTKTLVDFVDCNAITIDKGDISGGRWGIGNDVKANKRSVGFTVSNSKVHNNVFKGGDSHGGWFGSTDNLSVTNSRFEDNGDSASGANVAARCHDLYVEGRCGPASVVGNYFARCAGVSVQMRPGGNFLRNTSVDNPVHLSFGLVNGAGPVKEGGASGEIAFNSFVGTKPVGKTWLGYAIEASNLNDVSIHDNDFGTDTVVDPRLGTFPYAIKIDVCKLDAGNPTKKNLSFDSSGKQVVVKTKLAIYDNAGSLNGLTVWTNPGVSAIAKSRITAQSVFPLVGVKELQVKANLAALKVAN